jgi:hypothetical protein
VTANRDVNGKGETRVVKMYTLFPNKAERCAEPEEAVLIAAV